MPTLDVEIEESQLLELKQRATLTGVSVNQLVKRGIDSVLRKPRTFDEAAAYVIEKNAELLKRLAQ